MGGLCPDEAQDAVSIEDPVPTPKFFSLMRHRARLSIEDPGDLGCGRGVDGEV